MDRRQKVELFEQIRLGCAAGETILGLARKHGVHRRMVRQGIESAIPPERKFSPRQAHKLDPVKPFIDGILEADKQAPRKQRHTAHRIWTRVRAEHPEHEISESQVRRCVHKRKRECGLTAAEIFVPQSYQPGQEAQVDWYEAIVKLAGQERKLYFFTMRSMASGDAFHRAYPHATQQALLDGHEKAFAYFGGVFRTLRYDNMASLVKKILRGYQRVETDRIIAFRSHWGFQSEYCNPAKGNEKGGVEGELGRFRRNELVPVPEAADVDALNALLLARCIENRTRTISGRAVTVGQASAAEQTVLLPLADEGFPLSESIYPLIVDGKGRVKGKTNWYSAAAPAGTRVAAWVGPLTVEITHNNKCVANHPRCYGRGHEILDLEHYLDVLEHKPGAMAGSKPLEPWRKAGRWPECLDRIWRRLEERHGRAMGTRQMIGLVRVGLSHGWEKLIGAVEEALRLGVSDEAAVIHILHMPDAEQRRRYAIALAEELREFERPMPVMSEYDLLLHGTVGGVQ
jgi:transposase